MAMSLKREVSQNPYAKALGERLVDRVSEMQVATGNAFVDLQHEFSIWRFTLHDLMDAYREAVKLDEAAATQGVSSTLRLTAGEAVRQGIRELAAFEQQMASITATMQDKHDPALTVQFMYQIVQAAARVAHVMENTGDITNAEVFLDSLTTEIENNVRMPANARPMFDGNIVSTAGPKRTKLTPADIAREMAATIPYVPVEPLAAANAAG